MSTGVTGYIFDTIYDEPKRDSHVEYDMTTYNKLLDHFISLSPKMVVARIFGEGEEHLLAPSAIKEFLSTQKATYEGWTLCCQIPNVNYHMEMGCFPLEENINVVFFDDKHRVVRASCIEVLQCHGSGKDYPVFCHDLKTNKQDVYCDVAWAFDPNRTIDCSGEG